MLPMQNKEMKRFWAPLSLALCAIAIVPVVNYFLNTGLPVDYVGFIATFAVALFILCLFLVFRKLRAKLLLAVFSAYLAYVAFEVAVTTGKAFQLVEEEYYIWELPKNRTYDPVIGYKALSASTRAGKIIHGKVEYSVVNKGNNQGFLGAHDYLPKRKGKEKRILVLGDSFTGQKLYDQLWPDLVEQLAKQSGKEWELLNMSQAGYGLANWVSILENKILKEAWELDEVVLAVFEGTDLERPFVFGDHLCDRPFRANLSTWTLPDPTRADYDYLDYGGRAGWLSENFAIKQLFLTSEEYDQALGGTLPAWYKPSRVGVRKLRVYSAMVRACRRIIPNDWLSPFDPKSASEPLQLADGFVYLGEGHKRMMERFVAALKQLGKPVKVVHIFSKQEVCAGPDSDLVSSPYSAHTSGMGEFRGAGTTGAKDQVKALAAALHADLFDGRDAFHSIPAKQRAECFFVYDGHWNQRGANLFGRFVFERVLVGKQ